MLEKETLRKLLMRDEVFKYWCEFLNLKEKELTKNLAFTSFIEENFDLEKYDYIYDLCCGKGILGAYFALEGKDVIAVDKNSNNRRKTLIEQLSENYTFISADLWKFNQIENNSLIISSHACGNLTDRVIELSLQTRNDFAVISCCHNDRIYFSPNNFPDRKIVLEKGRDYYLDLIRLQYVREQGYDAGINIIPEEITPKNRIIWGKRLGLLKHGSSLSLRKIL